MEAFPLRAPSHDDRLAVADRSGTTGPLNGLGMKDCPSRGGRLPAFQPRATARERASRDRSADSRRRGRCTPYVHNSLLNGRVTPLNDADTRR